jgi:general stress protein CsbA
MFVIIFTSASRAQYTKTTFIVSDLVPMLKGAILVKIVKIVRR